MSVIHLHSLWSILLQYAVVVMCVGKLVEAERPPHPHHLVFIGM